MFVLNFLVDMLGAILAVLFVIYWALAGRIILENEKSWILKVVFLAALIVYPVYAPLVIYAVHYRLVVKTVRLFFSRRKQIT